MRQTPYTVTLPREHDFHFRVSREEREWLEQAAELDGRTPAQWARRAAVAEARRVLGLDETAQPVAHAPETT